MHEWFCSNSSNSSNQMKIPSFKKTRMPFFVKFNHATLKWMFWLARSRKENVNSVMNILFAYKHPFLPHAFLTKKDWFYPVISYLFCAWTTNQNLTLFSNQLCHHLHEKRSSVYLALSHVFFFARFHRVVYDVFTYFTSYKISCITRKRGKFDLDNNFNVVIQGIEIRIYIGYKKIIN